MYDIFQDRKTRRLAKALRRERDDKIVSSTTWMLLARLSPVKCWERGFKRTRGLKGTPVYVRSRRMNYYDYTLQPSFFQTQLHSGMADECRVVTQDSTASQYIDLDATGRHQSQLSTSQKYCLQSYTREEGAVYPDCENNPMEKANQHQQTAMICLTEFRKHTNDRNQLPLKHDLPRKRFRTTFSPSQLKRLESEFRCSMYVVGLKRLRLAQELKLEERHIKIWFQNRRMKFKRDQRVNERNGVAFQNYCFY